jgi:hypothetical protein
VSAAATVARTWPSQAAARAAALDWRAAASHLDAYGWALLPRLLEPAECDTIAGLYDEEDAFRSHVVMARHGFGRGEYKYFAYPLPEPIAALRTTLYHELAPLANAWTSASTLGVIFHDAT